MEAASPLPPQPETAPATFEALYERHRHRVYRWGLRFGGRNEAWAEDLVHDVFVKLLETLPQLEATGDLGGWLYRVTSNAALKRLERERSFRARVAELFASEPVTASPEAGHAVADALAAVEALPAKCRVVMLMHVVDEKRQVEIAEALGMSKGNVSKLLTRGRALLARDGWEVPDGE